MPQPAQSHGYNDCTKMLHYAIPPAHYAQIGERNEQIITQELRECDVPALPELLNTAGQKRGCEIPGQADSQQIGRSDGNIRIAREVEIDLEREQHSPDPSEISALWPNIKDIIDHGSETVR